MSATNHTPTLGLSQFVGGVDKPTWLGDYNSDMEKIDTSIHNLEIGTTSTISGQIKILDTSVQELFRLDTEQTVKIAANTSSIGSIQMNLTVAQEQIDALDKRETLHNTATTAQLDSQKTVLDDMRKNMNHFELNMNRIEDMAVLSTASIAKLDVRMVTAESDISGLQSTSNDYGVNIDNLKTEVDVLDTTTRIHGTQINSAIHSLTVLTSSVAANQLNLETYKEKTDRLMSHIQDTSNNNTTEITNIKQELSTTTNTANTVNTRTENITEGVAVPFGFGIGAGDKYGYIANGQSDITPFATATDISGIQDNVNTNIADIDDLKTRTSGITDGKQLPFSLAIDGSTYGYIPNGETGVVGFVSREEVNSIVDLEPIRADITSLESQTTSINNQLSNTNSNISSLNDTLHNTRQTVSDLSDNFNNIKRKTQNISDYVSIPFSFGTDSNGIYGYIKAGADTVTPFRMYDVNLHNLSLISGGNKMTITGIYRNVVLRDGYKILLNVTSTTIFLSSGIILENVRNDTSLSSVKGETIIYMSHTERGDVYIDHGVIVDRNNVVVGAV